jgi:hypothetical protein
MLFEADLDSVGLKNGIRSFYDINIDLEEQQKPHQKHIAPNKDRAVKQTTRIPSIVHLPPRKQERPISSQFEDFGLSEGTVFQVAGPREL